MQVVGTNGIVFECPDTVATGLIASGTVKPAGAPKAPRTRARPKE